VDRIPSGYSSRRMLSSRMPRPEPMLLPSQWTNWKFWSASRDSASFRITSKINSTNYWPPV
jgi:hypothetical protein